MNYFVILILALSFIANTLMGQDPGLKYYAAQAEPDTDWFLPEFDDSGWILDTGAIGFGSLFDEVTVPTETKSLYIRYKIEVFDPAAIEVMSFMGDFDDGYIAYLNGKEILRVNVSDSVKFPAYDDVTVRSHETRFTNYSLYSYYLDTLILDTCLVTGENIIAVHVLNDSLDGSDLHFSLSLYDLTGWQYNIYNPPCQYKRQYFIDSVRFPLVIIETDGFGIPYKRRVKAFMGIIDNGPDAYNKPTDSCNVYYGDVSIEVRGQSSLDFPKRSYRFEFKDSLDNDSNVVLLGMPSNDDWILFGPFQDKAQFRNPIIFDLARHFGRYQPRTRYCEVILNGEAVGLYSLIESIKRGNDRIDIQRLEPTEISGNDITGGYIMKYDKNDFNDQITWQIVYPKEDNIQPEQIEYITNFLSEYHSALFKNNFRDPLEGYRKYMSDTTLVDHMIMTELMKNCDGYVISTYLYKDRADKDNRIKYGPLWDNDLVFGNTIFHDGALTEGWQFDHDWPPNNQFIHVTRFLQDTAFVHLFQNRWFEARQKHLHTDSIMAYIDSAVSYLHDAVERNYYVWPVIDKDIFYSNYIPQSYDEEIWNIKNWLSERLIWMDDHIDEIYYDIDSVPEVPVDNPMSFFTFQVFPNPFDNELNIAFFSSDALDMRIDLIDINGQVKFIDYSLLNSGLSEIVLEGREITSLPAGFYIIRITLDDQTMIIRKILKR